MATANVPAGLPGEQHASGYPDSEHTHNRRTVLARLAAASAVTIPAAAIAGGVDPHPGWYAEWHALVDWCDGPGPGDRDLQDCPEWHRSFEVEELIASTPARTLAGALCQLRLARYYTSASHTGENADYAVENALVTLERLAGGQAHG